jgi:sugar phosphate isomerase/epimerase
MCLAKVENTKPNNTTIAMKQATSNGHQLGGHWLASDGVLNPGQGNRLTNAVRTVSDAGGTIFEIVGLPLNNMSAKETAEAVLAGGMTEVSYCRFFPGDGSLGDPLGDHGSSLLAEALQTFTADLAFISELREYGLTVKHMTGPSCFMIGFDYGATLTRSQIVARAIEFYRIFADVIVEMDLQINIEYLRPEEDKALGGLDPVIQICRALGPNFRWHADTFHMGCRRINPVMELRAAGHHESGETILGYFHVHGFSGREVPGQNLSAWVHDNERGWGQIESALSNMGYTGPLVAEPFGEVLRQQIPVLGEGLPPAEDPATYYAATFAFLRRVLG